MFHSLSVKTRVISTITVALAMFLSTIGIAYGAPIDDFGRDTISLSEQGYIVDFDPTLFDDAFTTIYTIPVGGGVDETGLIFPSDIDEAMLRMWLGDSFALSQELSDFVYHGWALAAGNIHQGWRIAQICISFIRGGVMVSSRACSTANSSGGFWSQGHMVSVMATDSIIPGPNHRTLFNIEVTRLPPGIL